MENKKIPTVSVSQVNRAVALMIKNDRRFSELSVKGEISDFTRHYKTGHLYFTLCDENSRLKAVMWENCAKKLDFSPENGESVICRGFLRVYEPTGVYEIDVVDMEKEGEGAQAKELMALLKKLERDGVFSQKRKIPEFPKKIAVITSQGGAALQDIINIVSRRCPTVELAVFSAAVQGADAPNSIVNAFQQAEKSGADTIIFGRGGGSSDDLSAFNSEKVARAIFASKIPTISAVGHQTDTTIADLAADLRAPTPSAAAELAVPDLSQILARLENMLIAVRMSILGKIASEENALNERARLINALSPKNKIAQKSQKVDEFAEKLRRSMSRKIELCEAALERQIGVISALSPLEVLKRGYSVTEKDGKAVVKSSELNVGDKVNIRLGYGMVFAEITDIRN